MQITVQSNQFEDLIFKVKPTTKFKKVFDNYIKKYNFGSNK